MLTLRGHAGPVWALAYSPDGTLLASGGADGSVRLWDMRERREPVVLRGHRNKVSGLAFSPDGNTLVSIGEDKQVRVWDVPTGLSHPLETQALSPTSVAFFPDGHFLAVGAGALTCLAVAPDGLVAAGSGYPTFVGRGYVTVWHVPARLRTAMLLMTDMGHWSAYNPRDRTAIDLGGSIRVVRLWKPGDRSRHPELPQRHAVLAVAFSPDGNTLAVGAGRRVTLWDPATGNDRAALKGHSQEVSALAFTPDGSGLLSGGIDRSVRLWDVAGGRARAAYAWPTGKVYAVAVAPDGLTAAAAGDASDIIVWDLEG